MNEMTNKQAALILDLVVMYLEKCESIEDAEKAVAKIKELADDLRN